MTTEMGGEESDLANRIRSSPVFPCMRKSVRVKSNRPDLRSFVASSTEEADVTSCPQDFRVTVRVCLMFFSSSTNKIFIFGLLMVKSSFMHNLLVEKATGS